MKKTLALVLTLVLALSLCACHVSVDFSPNSVETLAEFDAANASVMKDAITVETNSSMSSYNESVYVYVFQASDTYFRVECDFNEDLSNKFSELDILDADYDKKVVDLIGDLPIRAIYNLYDNKPSDDEVQTWVGKTGQELADAGFEPNSGWFIDDDSTTYYMTCGDFAYDVVFDGKATEDNAETDFLGMNVTSVSLTGISDSTSDPDWTPAE